MSAQLVVFTEDTSGKAPAVFLGLVKKLLQQLSPGLPTHRLPLVAAAPSAVATSAWHRHNWRGSSAKRQALVTELASRAKIGDIVLLHHDHDAAHGQPSALAAQVSGLVTEVARIVPPATWRGAILTLTPCYSVESWLYHNHDAVAALPVNERDAALHWLRENLRDTTGYDHIPKPKDTCPLNDKHNLTLATKAFPADLAAARSPSWQATQTRLSDSPPLNALLAVINPA